MSFLVVLDGLMLVGIRDVVLGDNGMLTSMPSCLLVTASRLQS